MCEISGDDVDTINRISYYRAFPGGGLLIPGEEEASLSGLTFYSILEAPDFLYPFEIDFSFIKMKKLKSTNYVREYIEKLRKMEADEKVNYSSL